MRRPSSYVNVGGESPPDQASASLAAWFLGPKGENEALLKRLAELVIDEHVNDRRGEIDPDDAALARQAGSFSRSGKPPVHRTDPVWLDASIAGTKAYGDGVRRLRSEAQALSRMLKQSVPFFSYRYQGHMLWDVTLPGVVGYLAGMLHNQNNVAAEASPVTTLLEMQVGDDLCRMLGYEPVRRRPLPEQPDEVGFTTEEIDDERLGAWGHLTSGGTVANIESMWSARNLKYYPVALAAALRDGGSPVAHARGLRVRLPDGHGAVLAELDPWRLLNLLPEDVLALPRELRRCYGVSADALTEALDAHSLQGLGALEFQRRHLGGVQPAAVVGTATMHYSWPKAASLLGIGAANVLRVPVDLDCRLSLVELRRTLDRCLDERRPVLQVVLVLGTTEHSAVDPIADVLALREVYRRAGLDFLVHVDAAWGGYFASMLHRVSKRCCDAAVANAGAAKCAGVAEAPADDAPRSDVHTHTHDEHASHGAHAAEPAAGKTTDEAKAAAGAAVEAMAASAAKVKEVVDRIFDEATPPLAEKRSEAANQANHGKGSAEAKVDDATWEAAQEHWCGLDGPEGRHRRMYVPAKVMSDFVERQFKALRDADSITVDPHKGGFIPYPAGALCYRDVRMRELVSLRSPVVYHGEADPSVGFYGVEGSKPGAAVAAVWLSHRVIGLDAGGYGMILGKTMFNAARLYAAIATMDGSYDHERYRKDAESEDGDPHAPHVPGADGRPHAHPPARNAVRGHRHASSDHSHSHSADDDFDYGPQGSLNALIVVPLQRLPAEQRGLRASRVQDQRRFIAETFVGYTDGARSPSMTNDALLRHLNDEDKGKANRLLFRELGPDQNIVAYAFNYHVEDDGCWMPNQSIHRLNTLNDEIFQALSALPPEDPDQIPLIVTASELDPRTMGEPVVRDFLRRLRIRVRPGEPLRTPIKFLISTVANPWLTDTASPTHGGSFIPEIVEVLRSTADEQVKQLRMDYRHR